MILTKSYMLRLCIEDLRFLLSQDGKRQCLHSKKLFKHRHGAQETVQRRTC